MPVFGVLSAGLRLIQPDGSLVTVARSAAAGVPSVPGNVVPAGTAISGRAIAEAIPCGRRISSTTRASSSPRTCGAGDGLGRAGDARRTAAREGAHHRVAQRGRSRGPGLPRRRRGLLQGFADQAALALENARLFGEAERRRREAELLAQLARSVNESLDLDVVLQRIAGAAQELCHSDIARIAMHDAGADAMMFHYWAGTVAGDWLSMRFEPGKGLGGQVLLTGRPARTDDYVNDRRFTREYCRWRSRRASPP